MDHHTAVGQCLPLAFFTGYEQHGSHRCSHTRADSGHITGHKLHGVVDAQAGGHAATGTVEIDGNVLTRVSGIQVEKLGLQSVGRIVVNLRTQENDAVHHQTGEHIHLGDVQLTLFKNIRIKIARLRLHNIVDHHSTHAQVASGIFSKIAIHIF